MIDIFCIQDLSIFVFFMMNALLLISKLVKKFLKKGYNLTNFSYLVIITSPDKHLTQP